jgi:hypothetical protein
MPSPFPGMDPYLEGAEWAGETLEAAGMLSRKDINE